MNKKYSITIVLIGTLIALSIGYVVLNMGSAPQKNITKTLKQILSQEETRMSFSDENAKLTNKYDKLSLLEKNFDILQTKIEASNDIESTKKIQKELSQLVFDAIEIASSIAVQ
jgi:uncharacterized protein HemX